MDCLVTYTFVCLGQNQVASFVDVQALPDGGHRGHAIRLLADHASAASVEVWRDDRVWDVVARNGVRTIGPDAIETSTAPLAPTALERAGAPTGDAAA